MEDFEAMQTETADLTAAELLPETPEEDDSLVFHDDAEFDGESELSEDDLLWSDKEVCSEPSDGASEEMRFQLRHFDEELTVDEKKVVELAQKGMDYERIRGKYDAMSAETARYRDIESFVRELAKDNGQTVEDYIDTKRAQKLMDSENSAGRAMSEEEALSRVKQLRGEAAATAEQHRARERMFSQLLDRYPELDVRSIPHEVLVKGVEDGDIIAAYNEHRMSELKKENEALRQNAKNASRTTGSRSSAGNGRKQSSFDTLWYDGT